MEQPEEFTIRFFTREDRVRGQLQTLFPADDSAAPKAAAVLPTEDMTFKDFEFLRKDTGKAAVGADQVIFGFTDVAQAYLILQDCEAVSLFTGPDRDKPVEGDLWAVRNGEWHILEEDVWSDPLWKNPAELADFIKAAESEGSSSHG